MTVTLMRPVGIYPKAAIPVIASKALKAMELIVQVQYFYLKAAINIIASKAMTEM